VTPSVGDLLGTWALDPGVVAGAALALGAYGWGVARAGAWPASRTLAFALGVATVVLALCSGIDPWAERMLSIHMVQHLALALAAAPLLVVGALVSLALRALPHGEARALARVLRSGPIRALTHPLVAWTLFAATMILTHLTGLYEQTLDHPALHAAEHAAYLTTAILFWLPVLGSEPLPHRLGWTGRMLYLLTAMPAMGFAGVVLSIDDHVRYTTYLAPARRLNIDALADQHTAGALMWVVGSTIAATLTLLVAWTALVQEERREQAREGRRDAATTSQPDAATTGRPDAATMAGGRGGLPARLRDPTTHTTRRPNPQRVSAGKVTGPPAQGGPR
jgi:putative membrane protein